jgi:hypothetical protein
MKEVMVKGTQIVKDNRTIKNRLSPYTHLKTFRFTNEMGFQLTFTGDTKRSKAKPVKLPKNTKKDVFCSMPTIIKQTVDKPNETIDNK